jgi:hypothetical protein
MKHLESQIIVPIRRKKPGYVKPSNYHCVCVCVCAQSNISTNCPQAKYPRTVHLDRRWMSSVVSLFLSLFLCFSISLYLYFSLFLSRSILLKHTHAFRSFVLLSGFLAHNLERLHNQRTQSRKIKVEVQRLERE